MAGKPALISHFADKMKNETGFAQTYLFHIKELCLSLKNNGELIEYSQYYSV